MRWEHTLPARLGAGPQPGSTSRAGWRGRQLAPQSAVRPAPSAAPRADRGPLRGLSWAPPAHLPAPLRPSEGPGPGAGAGRPLRKASVTWGVAGGWAAFRTGGGRQDEEAECGRGGRAAGIRRPRPGKKAGWPGLQTLRLQARWWRRLLLRLPQDPPRAGPRWRRSLHRVSCHPRNGPDHKRRGEDARAASGARKRVVEPDLAATPLPRPAPPESAGFGRGPPHWPSRLKGAGKVVCASAVACPRLPGKLQRGFACCCLRGA